MEYKEDFVSLLSIFKKQAARNANNIALFYKNEKMTYGELDHQSDLLAAYLLHVGVKKEDAVGVMLERTMNLIVAIFAVIKAGGVYLPILPSTPQKRLDYIVEDSKCHFVIKDSSKKDIVFEDAKLIDIDNKECYQNIDIRDLNIKIKPHESMYIIYTSGSTGRPKGIIIEHRAVVNRILWMQKYYAIDEKDVLLQKTAISFDVSIWELFWWSITGASLCLLPQGEEIFPVAVYNSIRKYNVSVIHFVPTMLDVFLKHIKDNEIADTITSLRQVFCSGEQLSVNSVKRFNSLFNNCKERIKMTNLYGPTEATIDVSYYDCPHRFDNKLIPIGKAIDNIELFVIDCETGKIVEDGIAGELCIAGIGLARGYVNKSLNEEHFIKNSEVYDKRYYRTGDLAKVLPDGNIQYLGRMDSQMKLNGLRIELAEIESVICQTDFVEQCVVLLKREEDRPHRLISFIVANKKVETKSLKKTIKQYLPHYMLPNDFIYLDEYPVNTSGKIDKVRLLEMVK